MFIVKFRRFKQREWKGPHSQQKVEEFDSLMWISIQKTFKGQNCTLQCICICQSKREGNFRTLDLNFSTFWCWEQIHSFQIFRTLFGMYNFVCNFKWIRLHFAGWFSCHFLASWHFGHESLWSLTSHIPIIMSKVFFCPSYRLWTHNAKKCSNVYCIWDV